MELWLIVGLRHGQAEAVIKPVIGYLLYAAGWIDLIAAILNNNIYGRIVLPTCRP